MKTKAAVVIISLGLFFGINNGVSAACDPAAGDYETCIAGGCCDISAGDYETCLASGKSACQSQPAGSVSAGQSPSNVLPGQSPSNTTANGQSPSNTVSSLSGNGIEIPTNTGLASGSIKAILENLLRWLLGIVGIIALIGFVVSGIQYVLSTGDEGMMDTAKRNMMYSIIGVIVALAGFVIIQAIDFALRAQSF